ncbi:MAG: sulfatase-like hydrolase/transferase, partial [Bacteroidetes bacterium]|nr:sulfatase-like hydrolase/transferase [Bacteroidota bacterium]
SHLLICLWLILFFSTIELIVVWQTKGLPNNFFQLLIISLTQDLLYWLKYIWIAYLIFIPLIMFIKTPAKSILKALIILFFIIHLLLTNYFNTALIPLGADLYGYSLQDIQETLNASGGINLKAIIILVIVFTLLIYIFFFAVKKIKFTRYTAIIVPILSFFLIFSDLFSINKELQLDSDFANNLTLNKSAYFYTASFNHFFPSADETNANYKEPIATNFTYIDPKNYPFLHQENTKDVLSPYFNKDSVKPNLVIILVEGLGRAFSNEGAYLGSFTPFLDSLATKSLYWENFLSQGGRTFAVLPSLLGSLPFAKNGFLEMGDKMPKHLSLINLLAHNGYQSSFYYGGDASFDHMADYLKLNNINQIRDEKTFPANYIKIPSQNKFSWGYEDSELFRYYLSNQEVNPQPKINIILTVSTHNPFKINNEKKYQALFEQRISKLGFDNAKKQSYQNYIDQYSSILYTDESLKNFFNNYKNRADYKNTIFIITGDHRMPEIPMSTKIDRYHVPLIIFSPLLKTNAKFKSISTHDDLTPSLLAYLKNSYQIKLPKLSSWVGEGLSTDKNFTNMHRLPLMQNKTDLIDFISGKYHLNGSNLYQMSADMDEELIENDLATKQRLIAEFNQFKIRNTQIINGKALLPDSILNKYAQPLK